MMRAAIVRPGRVTGTALGPFRLNGVRPGDRMMSFEVEADGVVRVDAHPAFAVRAADAVALN